MATWSKTKVTEAGLEMNAQALASGEAIEVTSANGFAADKPLQSVAAFDIAGITRQGQAAVVALQIDNATTETARRFNRIVLFAKLGEGPGESAPYAWIETDGGEMETIPAKSAQYKVLRVDVVLAFTGAENVTVTPTVNLGITKEQAQTLDAAAVDEHDKDPAAHLALAHSIEDTDTPSGNNGTIRKLLDRLANRIKAITGRGRWFDEPDITLAQTKERLDGLDNRVGTLDFIPNSRIGTTQNKIATLGYSGRFDKERLPYDTVYKQMLEDAIREALTWKELWRSYSGYTTTGTVIATLPHDWRECYIEHTVSGYKDDTQNLPIISREQVRRRDTFSWFGAKPEVYFRITSTGGVILVSRGAASDAYVYAIYYR